MPIHRLAIAVCATLAASSSLAQQQRLSSLPLPQMNACSNPSHPQLPPKWNGVFVLMPFGQGQLAMAEFISDTAVNATRTTLVGFQSGLINVLTVGDQSYTMTFSGGTGGDLLSCESLGDTQWRPLPQDLLSSSAQCVGSAPLVQTSVDWWKMPAQTDPAASWIWFKTDDGSPYRLMFDDVVPALGALGGFAFSYQVALEPLQNTGLSELVAACQRGAKPHAAGRGPAALRQVLDSMNSGPKAEATLRRLMPQLDTSCTGAQLPSWQQEMAFTSFMTPVNVNYNPFPTEVLYKWSRQSQRTRMYWPPSSGTAYDDALLIGGQGYDVTMPINGAQVCTADLPGTPRPNWPAASPCSCAAVIGQGSPLAPLGPTMIMQCPMILPRVFWTWYTLSGQPMVFMETKSPATEGTGLALADYYAFDPNAQIPDSAFTPPNVACPAPPPAGAAGGARPRLVGHRTGAHNLATSGGLPPQCFTCHLGSASAR